MGLLHQTLKDLIEKFTNQTVPVSEAIDNLKSHIRSEIIPVRDVARAQVTLTRYREHLLLAYKVIRESRTEILDYDHHKVKSILFNLEKAEEDLTKFKEVLGRLIREEKIILE